jgi:cell division protein FtsQ
VIEGFELKGKNSGDTLESEDSFKAKILTDIISELKAQDFQGITAIDLTSRTNIVMTYKDRIEMKLGSSVDMDYKLSCFKAVIEERLTDDYEGTLIYNGTESGVSAISKDREDDSSQTDTDSSDISDSSSDETLEDSSAAQTENQWAATTTAPAADAYSTDTTAGAYSTDTANGGYSDTTTTAVEYNNYSTDNQTTTGAYGW